MDLCMRDCPHFNRHLLTSSHKKLSSTKRLKNVIIALILRNSAETQFWLLNNKSSLLQMFTREDVKRKAESVESWEWRWKILMQQLCIVHKKPMGKHTNHILVCDTLSYIKGGEQTLGSDIEFLSKPTNQCRSKGKVIVSVAVSTCHSLIGLDVMLSIYHFLHRLCT